LLTECRKVRTALRAELVDWIAGIPGELHAKLAGRGLTDPRAEAPVVATAAVWCRSYIHRRRTEVKPATAKELEYAQALLVKHIGDAVPLDRITADNARDWRAWLLSPALGQSEGTVRKHTRNAKSKFAAAVECGLIPSSPFRRLQSAVLAAKREYLGVAESERILDELPDVHWRTLWGLARYAGLPCASKTHRLTWADVDFDKGRLRVHSVKTERFEAHRERVVPMPPRLRELLLNPFSAAPAESAQVLTVGKTKSDRHARLRAAIQRARLAPVPRVLQVAHQSAETDWARTYPQHAASVWLGHSVAARVKHYLTVTDDLLDAAAGLPAVDLEATDHTRMAAHGRQTVARDSGEEHTEEAGKQAFSGKKPIEADGSRTRNHRIDSPVL